MITQKANRKSAHHLLWPFSRKCCLPVNFPRGPSRDRAHTYDACDPIVIIASSPGSHILLRRMQSGCNHHSDVSQHHRIITSPDRSATRTHTTYSGFSKCMHPNPNEGLGRVTKDEICVFEALVKCVSTRFWLRTIDKVIRASEFSSLVHRMVYIWTAL